MTTKELYERIGYNNNLVCVDTGESIRELDRVEIHRKGKKAVVVLVAAPED